MRSDSRPRNREAIKVPRENQVERAAASEALALKLRAMLAIIGTNRPNPTKSRKIVKKTNPSVERLSFFMESGVIGHP
jgi:hypothetical protein